MLINLKKMVPEVVRERIETHDPDTYKEAKEYALKQVRNLKKTSKTHPLDLNEDEEEKEDQPEEEQKEYSKDELLAWMGKGPGKGNQKGSAPKGGKGKDGKGGFQGNCLYCGIWGHRLNECHKKTADMEKGKGKGMEQGWAPPAYKGKGKNRKARARGHGEREARARGCTTWRMIGAQARVATPSTSLCS